VSVPPAVNISGCHFKVVLIKALNLKIMEKGRSKK
jgi:hypothetical protein